MTLQRHSLGVVGPGGPQPRTPSGKGHEQINNIIAELESRYRIGFRPRGTSWSPSTRHNSIVDQCYDRIKYLHFSSELSLQRALKNFRDDAHLIDSLHRAQHLLVLLDREVADAKAEGLRKRSLGGAFAKSLRVVKDGGPVQEDAAALEQVRPKTPATEEDDDDSFATPPQSPSARPKRPSDSVLVAGESSKQPRYAMDGTTTGAFLTSSSFASAGTSQSIFSAQGDGTTTADTSFYSEHDGEEDTKQTVNSSDVSSSFPFSSASEEIMRILHPGASRDGQQLPQPLDNFHLQSPQNLPQASDIAQDTAPRTLEQHQIRSLPDQGFFNTDSGLPVILGHLPIYAQHHLAYLATTDPGLSEHVLSRIDQMDWTKPWIEACSSILSHRYDDASFREAMTECSVAREKISLKGSIDFGDSNEGALFHLTLESLQMEKSCRFHRAFGGDRFLYISMPPLSLPSRLKGQEANFQQRWSEWLRTPKSFLGHQWEILHVGPRRTKKLKGRSKKSSGHRLVFFATRKLCTSPLMPGLRAVDTMAPMSIMDVIDWFIPISKNDRQPFCKAFARLDLGFSSTDATHTFLPSQLRSVANIMSNEEVEDERFADQSIECTTLPPAGAHVMNDGCSLISPAAARQVWKGPGPLPSAFQARLAGAKGMWILSGRLHPAANEEVWIQISDSQRKFYPHEQDLNDLSFDRRRLTFEVNNFSSPLSSTVLHKDFVRILIDRGVPKTDLEHFVRSNLDAQREDLLATLEHPIRLRAWVDQQFSPLDRRDYNDEIVSNPGLPRSPVQRALLLLESGFVPTETPFLADEICRLVENHLYRIASNFAIPITRSTHALGIADPLGVVKPGEIHLAFSSSFKCEHDQYLYLDGMEVLVARQPAIRRSDMQRVRAVYKPELAHLVDVVVFPTRGRFPLAGKLQGGDYDGDSFWLTWDSSLVCAFRNAPAPYQPPTTEDYDITVDGRTVKDVLNTGFISAAVDFRMQENVLGLVTNRHEQLCYAENRLDSPGINALADLHDLLVDSAKNGYRFTKDDFEQYVDRHPHIDGKLLKAPAYSILLNKARSKPGGERWANYQRTKFRKENAIDSLCFEVVVPHVVETLKVTRDRMTSDAMSWDQVLRYPYWTEKESSDIVVRAELDRLIARLVEVYSAWGRELNAGQETEDSLDWERVIRSCTRQYRKIEPEDTSHQLIKRWVQKTLPGQPTDWDLIKASALFQRYHPKQSFVFTIAGKELAYIKAHSQSREPRAVVQPMWAEMKPRKRKRDGGQTQRLDMRKLRILGSAVEPVPPRPIDSDDSSDEYDCMSFSTSLQELLEDV